MAEKPRKRRSKREAEAAQPSDEGEDDLEWLLPWIPCLFFLAFLIVSVLALWLSANGGWITKQGMQARQESESSEKEYGDL